MELKNKTFSVVIPTYTGQDYIIDCFESILAQDNLSDFDFDVIVVIDGPNRTLERIVDEQSRKFQEKNISFYVHEFSGNKGRFKARQKGAKESKKDYLLFVDDRNILAHNYFKKVLRANKDSLIPSVIEKNQPNFIAKTMYYIRKNIYGNKWGKDFVSYEINKDNFEKSPKGTAGFWIKKDIFIAACEEIRDKNYNIKTLSDDTKLMKYIINQDMSIYKSSEIKLYYQPRKSATAEIKHIFNRGPMFIDYYLRPSTRFFWPLLLFYAFVLIILFLAILAPFLLLLLTVLVLLGGLFAVFYTVGFSLTAISVFVGAIVIVVSFGLGLLKGIILKIVGYNR
jgi:glycosyltransferase involved in cell wall biosynthesis